MATKDKDPCLHDKIQAERTRSLVDASDDIWQCQCLNCGQWFDVVWSEREEESDVLYGVEIIRR